MSWGYFVKTYTRKYTYLQNLVFSWIVQTEKAITDNTTTATTTIASPVNLKGFPEELLETGFTGINTMVRLNLENNCLSL